MDTKDAAYAARLEDLQYRWWKRPLRVIDPYRWHHRRTDRGRVLEVGCGIGRVLGFLDGRGVGVDHNAEAVAVCRRLGHEAWTTEEFLDRHRPGGVDADRRYDTLLTSHVLEHMTVPEAVDLLRTYLPYLAPGGRVVTITPMERGFASDPTHVQFMDFETVLAVLREVGLRPRARRSFPFPRPIGRVFIYNEFVTVATKPE